MPQMRLLNRSSSAHLCAHLTGLLCTSWAHLTRLLSRQNFLTFTLHLLIYTANCWNCGHTECAATGTKFRVIKCQKDLCELCMKFFFNVCSTTIHHVNTMFAILPFKLCQLRSSAKTSTELELYSQKHMFSFINAKKKIKHKTRIGK